MFRKIAKKILTKSPKAYTAIHTSNFERSHKQDFSKLGNKEKEALQFYGKSCDIKYSTGCSNYARILDETKGDC